MEMIVFIGIQAVGKSEFYKRKFYKSHIRINLDMLKTRNREKILIEACFKAKQPFVIDNTNPTVSDRKKYITIAKNERCKVVGYYFKSSIAEALERNGKREGSENLPSVALKSTYAKLELPNMEEGFDELFYVHINQEGEFIIEEYSDEI